MAIFQVSFMADTLHRTVPIHVILPTDKIYFPGMPQREAGKPYKTLYLMHGVIGSDIDWIYGTRIQRWAEERDLAVVMCSGENGFYVDQPWNCTMYGEFVGKELVEFTRKTFPLSHKKEDTYIGGLSMGGYGAIRNGLKYNDTFGAIVAFSSALVVNEDLPHIVENPMFFIDTAEYKHSCFGPDLEAAVKTDVNPKVIVEQMLEEHKEFPKIYMTCGNADSLLTNNQDFSEFLTSKNIEHTFEIGDGGHEWDFWDTYLPRALEWLPLESKEQGVSSGNVGI